MTKKQIKKARLKASVKAEVKKAYDRWDLSQVNFLKYVFKDLLET